MLHSNIFFYPVTKYSLLLLMDRFITRIPKTPQNAVINQIRAVPEVSSKQASAEKISHEFIKKYFLEYKCKNERKLFCKACSLFPDEWKKKPLLVIGKRVQVMAL